MQARGFRYRSTWLPREARNGADLQNRLARLRGATASRFSFRWVAFGSSIPYLLRYKGSTYVPKVPPKVSCHHLPNDHHPEHIISMPLSHGDFMLKTPPTLLCSLALCVKP